LIISLRYLLRVMMNAMIEPQPKQSAPNAADKIGADRMGATAHWFDRRRAAAKGNLERHGDQRN
jgi:hypothetical protein